MSSLLTNDFNEEFFTITRNLETNRQAIYIDDSKRVIFTTPFQTTDIFKVNQELDLNQKISPENANIVFDSVTIFTTNPNIQNYLPIKLNFSGKPQISLIGENVITLKDYRITTDPPLLEADVANHRYGDLRTLSIERAVPASLEIRAVCQFKNRIYWQSRIGLVKVQFYDFDTDTYGNLVNSENIVTFKNNSKHLVGLGDDELFDIVNDKLIYENTDPDTAITDFVIKLDTLIINEDNTTTGIKPKLTWINLYGDYIVTRIIDDLFTVNGIGGYITFDAIDTNTLVFAVAEQFVYLKVAPVNYAFTKTAFEGSIKGVNQATFASGDIRSDIDVIQVTRFGNELLFYKVDLNLSNRETLPKYRVDPIKRIRYTNTNWEYVRYLNQVMWQDTANPDILKFYNLDTNEVIDYSFEIDDNPVYIPDLNYPANGLQYIHLGTGISFNEFSIIVGGFPFPNAGPVTPDLFNIFFNERVKNETYKVTFNFYGQQYPIELSSRDALNFSITLPNVGTTPTLEIFNYVIDYRIRYSKQKTLPNPSVPRTKQEKAEEEELRKNRRFKRQGPVVRDTEDILGLVDPDQFNVQDFLQIYNPN